LLASAWAGESANYKIRAEVLDSGGSRGNSASYQLLGKARERALPLSSSPGLTIGEGFLRSVYFARATFAPIVTGIQPPAALNNGPLSVTISGANYLAGASVKLTAADGKEIVGSKVVVVGAEKINCELDLTGAKPGSWSVTVTNPDGRSGTLPAAFKIIYPAPTVSAIIPDRGVNNEVASFTIAGENFRTGAAVKLSKAGESDIMGEKLVVVSAAKLTGSFDLRKKSVGAWDLKVTNEDGQAATNYQIFKIEAPELEVLEAVKNKPNPFSPQKEPTMISYILSQDSDITVDIFNVRGERIWQYQAGRGKVGGMAGYNAIGWNGITAFNAYASDGVYFLYVSGKVNGQTKILSRTKMAIIK
jgi:hypothetical protein